MAINSANADEAGVLKLLCHGPLQESGETYGTPSQKNVCTCREIVGFIQVNKHFWSLEAINYFVAYIHY